VWKNVSIGIARDFPSEEAVHRVIPDKPRDYKCNSRANSVSGNIRVLLPRPDEAFRGKNRRGGEKEKRERTVVRKVLNLV